MKSEHQESPWIYDISSSQSPPNSSEEQQIIKPQFVNKRDAKSKLKKDVSRKKIERVQHQHEDEKDHRNENKSS